MNFTLFVRESSSRQAPNPLRFSFQQGGHSRQHEYSLSLRLFVHYFYIGYRCRSLECYVIRPSRTFVKYLHNDEASASRPLCREYKGNRKDIQMLPAYRLYIYGGRFKGRAVIRVIESVKSTAHRRYFYERYSRVAAKT